MTQLFKKIRQADAARKAKELDAIEDNKIAIVETAAKKISSVLSSSLSNVKLHTTTKRIVERESKLKDAIFFALEKVLEVKSFSHHLKREDLEKLRNTKVSTDEINNILEMFNTGLVVHHGVLTNEISELEEKIAKEQSKEDLKNLIKKLNGKKQEKILISQVQEIVATYLSIVENKASSQD